MPRVPRLAPGGKIYHVLNRGNGRCRLFLKEPDYAAFETLLFDVADAVPVRILAWCLMPNHWHLVLRPREDGQLSNFMLRLTTAHVRRNFAHYHATSGGHLYQGRFKSFPVQDDHHFLTLCRYVEANPLRAKLTDRAADWRWSSLYPARHRKAPYHPEPWPVPRPRNWEKIVEAAQSKDETEQLKTSLRRGRPFGSDAWVTRTFKEMGLQFTLRDRGRPRKENHGK